MDHYDIEKGSDAVYDAFLLDVVHLKFTVDSELLEAQDEIFSEFLVASE